MKILPVLKITVCEWLVLGLQLWEIRPYEVVVKGTCVSAGSRTLKDL
jgi:hypothetical protein